MGDAADDLTERMIDSDCEWCGEMQIKCKCKVVKLPGVCLSCGTELPTETSPCKCG